MSSREAQVTKHSDHIKHNDTSAPNTRHLFDWCEENCRISNKTMQDAFKTSKPNEHQSAKHDRKSDDVQPHQSRDHVDSKSADKRHQLDPNMPHVKKNPYTRW